MANFIGQLPARLTALLLIGFILIGNILKPATALAATQLLARSMEVSTATPSAASNHTINFSYQSNNNVGSMQFLYCSNSPRLEDPCDRPIDMDFSGAALTAQGGNTGFTLTNVDNANHKLILSRASQPVSAGQNSYTLGNIVNPSSGNYTVFVRITVYSSNDASGSYSDFGAVAYSTTPQLAAVAYVPPYLTFCAGKTVALDCSTSSTSLVDLGTLKTNAASTGTSQMAAATNDNNGYFISMLGTTMTSGNDEIPALATPTSSQPGSSQFGLNFRDNSSPDVGLEPSGNGTAAPTANYGQVNAFTFNDGDTVVAAPNSTEYNRMTVSYLANINSAQPPGIYTTTITFIATAQF